MVEEAGNIASSFLAGMFGPSTEGPVYVASRPNNDAPADEPRERRVMTRVPDVIDAFVRKWDRRNRALYFCVGTVKPDATRRAKETIAELNGLHVDIDFKTIDATPEEVERKLRQVMLLPTTVVASVRGLHGYWLFRESLVATPETIDEVEVLLRLLADHLGSDPSVCEVSRLMRLPGSHNSKSGAWAEVTVMTEGGPRYDLHELEDWLTMVSPILRRKVELDGSPVELENPFLAAARRLGFKPPVDVEQRLAAMRYQGTGESAIHNTQLSVSAALLNRGTSIEEVVTALLDATRAAAGQFGERWNWRREESAVRKMCETWLAKHPPPPAGARRDDVIEIAPAAEEEPTEPAADGATKPQAKTRAKTKSVRPDEVTAIADGVIEAVRQEGHEMLLTGGELHLYESGVWRIANSGDEQHLKVRIQEGAQALGQSPKLSLLNSVWRRLTEHPNLYRGAVDWDSAPEHIAVSNGTLNLAIHKLGDWRPDYHLRRKLAVAFDRTAAAPLFAGFVNSLFADQDEATRKQSIGLLQEFFGLCLAPRLLNREQRRALLLLGPSRVGKTELALVVRLLVGGVIASPAVKDISERFGLATFIGANAWIRDDAVNEGDHLDPERFKTVVTGEPIDIERKNRAAIPVRLNIPVLLTANELPTARDNSDAVFNRCLILKMGTVVTEERAVELRRLAGVPAGMKLADWLFAQDGPGILNWALEGLRRLLERGHFDIPKHVATAIEAFKDESNSAAEFAHTMLVRSDTGMIERADLICAFQGWWREEMGEGMRLVGGRWLGPKLRAACPWIDEIKVRGVRHWTGIALTDGGLKFWERQSLDALQSKHGCTGSSSGKELVNKTRSTASVEPLFK